MKAFLWEEKQFFEVNRKEEITSNTYIISDFEYDMIKETMENGGHLWLENGEVKWSGIKPDEVMVWDDITKEWGVDELLFSNRRLSQIDIMWEQIKSKRLEETVSGVYVQSIDKWFHTDEVSAIQYAQIGNTISLDIFEPLTWKTMEGDFIEMTAELFKEFQVLMMLNTQGIYEKAEWHKVMMESIDDPLSYDYSQNW